MVTSRPRSHRAANQLASLLNSQTLNSAHTYIPFLLLNYRTGRSYNKTQMVGTLSPIYHPGPHPGEYMGSGDVIGYRKNCRAVTALCFMESGLKLYKLYPAVLISYISPVAGLGPHMYKFLLVCLLQIMVKRLVEF